MTHASWKQAILISATVAMLAIAGVVTLAWLRRPATPAAPGARNRPPTPLLYHDPTGSVYDLNLKMTQLEERLLSSEQHSRRLEEEVARLQKEREAREKERGALEKRLAQMEKDLARLQRPPVQTPPAASSTNTPDGSIEITPQNEGGTGTSGTEPTTPP